MPSKSKQDKPKTRPKPSEIPPPTATPVDVRDFVPTEPIKVEVTITIKDERKAG